MIVGGYTLDVYCEAEVCKGVYPSGKKSGQFYAQTARGARREARQAGWVLREGHVRCPACAKAARR